MNVRDLLVLSARALSRARSLDYLNDEQYDREEKRLEAECDELRVTLVNDYGMTDVEVTDLFDDLTLIDEDPDFDEEVQL